VASSTGAGELGADDVPGDLGFFTAARAAANDIQTAPDAVGTQIVSTGAPSVCRDDLSFVVLNQAISGVLPVPIRIDSPTAVGESVSVLGYGFTSVEQDPIVLRGRDDIVVVGVGPPTPSSTTQPAPVRSLRLGPGAITCNGDSGGPIFSNATGALIGLISFGAQATSGPYCTPTPGSDETTGPVLSDYRDLVLSAFAAAGATPIEEAVASSVDGSVASEASVDASDSQVDAASDGGDSVSVEDAVDGTAQPQDASPRTEAGGQLTATGAGCEVLAGRGVGTRFPWDPVAAVGVLVVAVLARRRRSRNRQFCRPIPPVL
jgi:hypothetical protein